MNASTSDDSNETSSPFPSYYSGLAEREYLTSKLRNLDDSAHFAECRQRLMNEASRNFVVDFGDEDAWCAFNLESNDFSTLLNAPVSLTGGLLADIYLDKLTVSLGLLEYIYTHTVPYLETKIARNEMDV